jgi:uncharacterized protein YegL
LKNKKNMRGSFKMSEKTADRPVRRPGEPHLALTLVLDVSASMQGESIKLLNAAVNNMISQMKADERLKHIIDLSILVFGTHGRQNAYQGFRAIADCDTVKLEANDNSTYVVAALEQAIKFLRNRCKVYNQGVGCWKPWIVLITDGEFHDDNAALNEIGAVIKERESNGKLRFFGLGVDKYERKQLEKLTNDPAYIIDAKIDDFGDFFSWLVQSMSVISSSAIGESVALPALSKNLRS